MANIGKFKVEGNKGWLNVATLIGENLISGQPYVIQILGSANLVFCSKMSEPLQGEGFILKPYTEPFGYTPLSDNDLWVKTELTPVDGEFNITA